jgi:hypothetical protein
LYVGFCLKAPVIPGDLACAPTKKDAKNAVGSCNSPEFRQESGGKTDGASLFHPVEKIFPWEVSQNAKLTENRGTLHVRWMIGVVDDRVEKKVLALSLDTFWSIVVGQN